MRVSTEQVLDRLHYLGVASRGELAQALGTSAATVYRHLQQAERAGDVARFGRARATRYAVRAPLFGGVAGELPLYRVDGAGQVHRLATLTGLAGGAVLVRPPSADAGLPRLFLGENATGYFDDLPFFLQDLRPQGFLGRQYAHAVAELRDNPEHWNAAQVGAYLLDHAVDLPGDLLLGDAAVDRLRYWRPDSAAPADFPALAERALAGDIPGSSAGGEQPKFPAEVAGRQVLVKFSPAQADSAVAQRWRDLLVCEHLALATLEEHGLPVAANRLLEEGGRFFLESRRFDRTGQGGRLPALSLWALDAEFVGAGQGWSRAAAGMVRQGWLAEDDRARIVIAETFADWIENTDQHLGNITLQPQSDGPLTLAPLYDMVPMRHAPRQGEVPPMPAYRVPASRGDPGRWAQAGAMAARFWSRAAGDARITEGFRVVAADRAAQIERVLEGFDGNGSDHGESGIGW